MYRLSINPILVTRRLYFAILFYLQVALCWLNALTFLKSRAPNAIQTSLKTCAEYCDFTSFI